MPLIGREMEMYVICALLDTVALNRPTGARALTISGDIGVGKSRLLAEMFTEARARGFRVLEGRTYESGRMFPYLPFIEALRPVLSSSPPEYLRRYMGLESDQSGPRDIGLSDEKPTLTPAGDRLRRSVEAAIRASEEEVLGTLPPADREAFLRSLKALYECYRAP